MTEGVLSRLLRLFREPTDGAAATGTTDDGGSRRARADGDGQSGSASEDRGGAASDRGDGGDGDTDAIAVVVQAPPAGIRRFELTLRAGVPVTDVDPELLTSHFEAFDEGTGTVRARAVDMEGHGRTIEAAAPLFVVRFGAPVDPDTVSLDGTVDGHDEEPVPWSRVRLTPVD
ncbi:hypothetical protein [Salinigranum marinum]|uniref:hypothetical protein n=1 Tax=Salinigranum marinum TaxID=1515595 RepID=UPI002989FD9D|nr:hypothetical protein [Salinigranum marinum]